MTWRKKNRPIRTLKAHWKNWSRSSSNSNPAISPLDDSLAAFEKGVGLVKFCNHKLNEVEKKVELLIKDKEGKIQLKALHDLPEEDAD